MLSCARWVLHINLWGGCTSVTRPQAAAYFCLRAKPTSGQIWNNKVTDERGLLDVMAMLVRCKVGWMDERPFSITLN